MKISLVLGVKVYVNTSFVEYLEPCSTTGWRMTVKPSNKEIEMIDFDVSSNNNYYYKFNNDNKLYTRELEV